LGLEYGLSRPMKCTLRPNPSLNRMLLGGATRRLSSPVSLAR
jgi:hypothetical protein